MAGKDDGAGDFLIQEVDEDLRREYYERLWKRYGNYAIAGAVAIVLGVAGYQFWQDHLTKQRQEEASRFAAAHALAADGKTKEASEALSKLAADSSSGYAPVAEMSRADILMNAGDAKGAITAYDSVAASRAAPIWRDLAIIKSALLSVDTATDLGALEGRVATVAVAGNPWYYSANELLAMIAHKKGDFARAMQIYKQISDDADAPPGIRARAAETLAAIGQKAPASSSAPKPPAKG